MISIISDLDLSVARTVLSLNPPVEYHYPYLLNHAPLFFAWWLAESAIRINTWYTGGKPDVARVRPRHVVVLHTPSAGDATLTTPWVGGPLTGDVAGMQAVL